MSDNFLSDGSEPSFVDPLVQEVLDIDSRNNCLPSDLPENTWADMDPDSQALIKLQQAYYEQESENDLLSTES